MTEEYQAPVDAGELQSLLDEEISPALASHLGGIEISENGGSDINLRMTGSCRACYFRAGCIDILVIPTLHDKFGEHRSITAR